MKQQGFTLLELMITMTIAGVVLTIGVPYFQDTIRQNRLTSYTNQFVGALNLARSEAVKRGVNVTLCRSSDGAACAANNGYEQGWIIFTDPNANSTVDVGEIIIRAYEKMPQGMTLTGSTGIQGSVSYTSAGVSTAPAGPNNAWMVCKDGKARTISITTIGRIAVNAEPTSPTCP